MSKNDISTKDVEWSPATPHPTYKVVADKQEGYWVPAPGYRWADDPPVISNLLWCPGAKHPQMNLLAGQIEGQWEPAPGYTWKGNQLG